MSKNILGEGQKGETLSQLMAVAQEMLADVDWGLTTVANSLPAPTTPQTIATQEVARVQAPPAQVDVRDYGHVATQAVEPAEPISPVYREFTATDQRAADQEHLAYIARLTSERTLGTQPPYEVN